MKYSFKVAGLERKAVASVIAAALFTEATYSGAPSFNYQAGGLTIDREGVVTAPEKDSLRPVLDALTTAGATAEGNSTVTLGMDGHNGNTLRNLANLIWAKQDLIQKALARPDAILPESLVTALNAVPIETLEDFAKVVNDGIDSGAIQGESGLDFDLTQKSISFSFANATLDADEVGAFITLCQQISLQAQKQKFSSIRQKESANDKYSMRCFLLKLGFIGAEYKTERKKLLSRLSGNAAFRTPEAQQAAEAKRKGGRSDE